MTSLLGISGSLRAASVNTQLVHAAAAAFEGATLTMANLRLPLYDGDLEDREGIPAEVATLAAQIAEADGIVISTPEYNKNLPGVLKNALDWVSRVPGGAFKDKPVAVLSAAAGRAGGERAQNSLRLCLQPLFPRVIPGPEVMVAAAHDAFDDTGGLKDERGQQMLAGLMEALRKEIAR